MPLVALLPLGVILTTYFSHTKMPFRIPGGAWAVLLGTAAAWILWAAGHTATPVAPSRIGEAMGTVGLHLPMPVLGDLIAGLRHPLGLIPVALVLSHIEPALRAQKIKMQVHPEVLLSRSTKGFWVTVEDDADIVWKPIFR